jgi:hypothetical protein
MSAKYSLPTCASTPGARKPFLGKARVMVAAARTAGAKAVGWFAGGGRDEAKRILGVPGERLVGTALSLGYPECDPPRGRSALPRGRKPMAELLHEELYGRRLPGAERKGRPGSSVEWFPPGGSGRAGSADTCRATECIEARFRARVAHRGAG